MARWKGQPSDIDPEHDTIVHAGCKRRARPRLTLGQVARGGYLPVYPARHEHALSVRPDARGMVGSIRDRLSMLWFDTVVYDALSLRHLVERVGVERVLLGTDFPFDMGSYDFERLLSAECGLDAAGRASVLGENALSLLRRPRA